MGDLPPVYLICIDDFPVEPRFIGLGQLSPENLKSLWDGRFCLTTEYFSQGARVWQALVQDTPDTLYALVENEVFLVPQMKGALKRHLQQLPAPIHGLSLTEELSLKILKNDDNTGGKIFRQLMLEDEPLPYLGDLMFADELEALVNGGAIDASGGDEPWHKQNYSLTELGAAILAGEKDWVHFMPKPRWVGGVEIKPNEKVWRQRDIVNA